MTEITQADTHIISMTVAAFKTSQEQSRMEERAAIVAYLRLIAECIRKDADEGLWHPLTECEVQGAIDQYNHCAEFIEEGEHLE